MGDTLERIIKATGLTNPKVVLPILLTMLPIVHNGCTVPLGYAKKQGWTQEEKKDSMSKYERSLKSEFLEDGENDPNNKWRVLNYMMHYLAQGKAISEGPNSQTSVFLNKIRNLNVVYDSLEVESLYSKIFADEDTRWNKTGKNQFIHDELVKRMDQVIRWAGFDTQGWLTNWGKQITRWGPFQLESMGDTYVVGLFKDGLTYKAIEGSDFRYHIDKVAQGAIDVGEAPPDPLADNSGATARTSNIGKSESEILKMEHQHEMSVPVAYKPLDVREVKVTRFPAPLAGKWKGLDKSFYQKEWDGERFIIDVYADIENFITEKNASGKTMLPFDLEYIVHKITPLGAGADTLLQVASGKDSFNYDITNAGKSAGFNARIFTDAVSDEGTYQVDLKITNKDRTLVKKKVISVGDKEYPLEIVSKYQKQPIRGVPSFAIEPVSKKDNSKLYFSLDGLHQNRGDGFYYGVAYVLLMDPNDSKGTISIGDMAVVKDTLETKHAPVLSYDNNVPNYGSNCIDTLVIKSATPRGFFVYDLNLPKNVKTGTQLLALDFYSINLDTKKVENIGSASRNIQIE